jgi:dnd system-associated protein 4
MATVFFDKEYAHFVKSLCEEKDEKTNKSLFENNIDFMIFAAMVGKHFDSSIDEVKINQSNKSIPDRIFKNSDRQGMAYLLALESTKSANILKDDQDSELECWKHIERYAYLGCEKITEWLADRPKDNFFDIILDQVMEVAATNIELEQDELSQVSSEKDIKF